MTSIKTFYEAIQRAESFGPQYRAVWPDSAEPSTNYDDAPYEGRVFAVNKNNDIILGEVTPLGGLDVAMKGLPCSCVEV